MVWMCLSTWVHLHRAAVISLNLSPSGNPNLDEGCVWVTALAMHKTFCFFFEGSRKGRTSLSVPIIVHHISSKCAGHCNENNRQVYVFTYTENIQGSLGRTSFHLLYPFNSSAGQFNALSQKCEAVLEQRQQITLPCLAIQKSHISPCLQSHRSQLRSAENKNDTL